MYSLNKAMIIGNLTRDPESRTIPSGQSLSSFSVATSYGWKDQNGEQQSRTEFHNVEAWGKLGEICSQYLSKGKKVYIEGRLQTDEWSDQEGNKKQRTKIVANDLIVITLFTTIVSQSSNPLCQFQRFAPNRSSVTERT